LHMESTSGIMDKNKNAGALSREKGELHMEERMLKIYAKESNRVALHAIPGHFATSHSHINYYIDITNLKTSVQEAKAAAALLYQKIGTLSCIDTIVCMDGTEVIGAFLAEEFEQGSFVPTEQHESIYVVAPELNSNNQLIFRDNNRPSIEGKHVLLLLATTTTGKTINRSMEGIRYYGGIVEGVASVFGTIDMVEDMQLNRIFTEEDLPSYAAYLPAECPFCKKGERIEAMVNGFGYSKF